MTCGARGRVKAGNDSDGTSRPGIVSPASAGEESRHCGWETSAATDAWVSLLLAPVAAASGDVGGHRLNIREMVEVLRRLRGPDLARGFGFAARAQHDCLAGASAERVSKFKYCRDHDRHGRLIIMILILSSRLQ